MIDRDHPAVEAAARAALADGWTCDTHEPRPWGECPDCTASHIRTAPKALAAALPHLTADDLPRMHRRRPAVDVGDLWWLPLILVILVLTFIGVLVGRSTTAAPPYTGEAVVTEHRHTPASRTTPATWALNVCPTTRDDCRWIAVPRAVYETAHEDMLVTVDRDAVVITEDMRP